MQFIYLKNNLLNKDNKAMKNNRKYSKNKYIYINICYPSMQKIFSLENKILFHFIFEI
jgi:hypothetical protein